MTCYIALSLGVFFILDEHSRECLAIGVKLNSTAITDTLTDPISLNGVPAFIRSDNGAGFIA